MALKKPIPTSFDVDAIYWNIGEEHVDYREGNNRVVLYGYANAAARAKKAAPLSSAQITISGADFSPGMDRASIYTHIKTKVEQFAASEDI